MNPLGLPSKFLYFFRLTGIIPLFAGNISSLELVCFCHSVSFSHFTAMRLCYKIESMKYL